MIPFGIISMTDLGIVSVFDRLKKVSFEENPLKWITDSLLPYIAITVADFMVGLALYGLTVTGVGTATESFS